MTIHDKLSQIQSELNAPKGQYNSFGKYHYRNCEDILQALKPFLAIHKCHLVLSDEVVMVGNRLYIKATATLSDGKETLSATAFAREADSKKGMDDSQLTGATSSYARKYALNGLFAIDDNKDADTLNNHQGYANPAPPPKAPPQNHQQGFVADNVFQAMLRALQNGVDKDGKPFTMQSVFDYLGQNNVQLTQAQKQHLGV